jgi:hypothetical protein
MMLEAYFKGTKNLMYQLAGARSVIPLYFLLADPEKKASDKNLCLPSLGSQTGQNSNQLIQDLKFLSGLKVA